MAFNTLSITLGIFGLTSSRMKEELQIPFHLEHLFVMTVWWTFQRCKIAHRSVTEHDYVVNIMSIKINLRTALIKQSSVPLYTFGLFIILVFTTSAGVLMVAAISPAQPLKNTNKVHITSLNWVLCRLNLIVDDSDSSSANMCRSFF